MFPTLVCSTLWDILKTYRLHALRYSHTSALISEGFLKGQHCYSQPGIKLLDDICCLPVLNGEGEAAPFKNCKRFQTFKLEDLVKTSNLWITWLHLRKWNKIVAKGCCQITVNSGDLNQSIYYFLSPTKSILALDWVTLTHRWLQWKWNNQVNLFLS